MSISADALHAVKRINFHIQKSNNLWYRHERTLTEQEIRSILEELNELSMEDSVC